MITVYPENYIYIFVGNFFEKIYELWKSDFTVDSLFHIKSNNILNQNEK